MTHAERIARLESLVGVESAPAAKEFDTSEPTRAEIERAAVIADRQATENALLANGAFDALKCLRAWAPRIA